MDLITFLQEFQELLLYISTQGVAPRPAFDMISDLLQQYEFDYYRFQFTPPPDDLEITHAELVNVIGEMLVALYDSINFDIDKLFSDLTVQMGLYTNIILFSVEDLLYTFFYDIQDDINLARDEIIYRLSQQTNQLISQYQQGINTILSNLSQVSNTLINSNNQQTAILSNQLTQSTNQLITEIRSIDIESSTDVILDTDDLELRFDTYFPQLILRLMDIKSAIENKDIDVNVDLFNPDSTASIPIDFGFELSELANLFNPTGIVNFSSELLGVEMGDITGYVGERLSLLLTIVNKIISNEYDDYETFISELRTITGGTVVTDVLLSVIVFLPILVNGILQLSNPFANNIETLARTKALDSLLTPDTLRELLIREMISYDKYLELSRKIGYNAESAELIRKAGTAPMPFDVIRDAYLRDKITEETHDRLLGRLGFNELDMELIRLMYQRIPPIPDLIRFAVREAYDDNLANDLQLDANYDDIKDTFESYIMAQGLSPEFGKYYWRSHWQLPSPSQGFEMYHRGIIEYEDLEQLLRVLDYSPNWQGKLIQLSETPFTRVDIRRMHKVGELDDDGVFKAYKDLGYNDDKALKMVNFTKILNTEVTSDIDKTLSVSAIVRALNLNIISHDSAVTYIQNIGYDLAETNLLIAIGGIKEEVDSMEKVIADNKRRVINMTSKGFIEGRVSEQTARIQLGQIGYTLDETELEIQTLRIERNNLRQFERVGFILDQYINFRIDDNEARARLVTEGFSPYEENDIIALWNTVRKARFKAPTKAELKGWYLKDKINQSEYRNYLYGMGYDARLTDLYIQDALDAKANDDKDTIEDYEDDIIVVDPPIEPIPPDYDYDAIPTPRPSDYPFEEPIVPDRPTEDNTTTDTE